MEKISSASTLKKLTSILSNTSQKARFLMKLSLGTAFLVLFLSYEPSLKTPPFKRNYVLAESEQTQSIASKSLPFVFKLPHPGYLSTPFSTYHPGIDIATGLGMPIHSIAPGKVISTGYDFWGLGLNVVIEHEQGYKSTYAHLGKIYVNVDQVITENTLLGEVGLTGHTSGPHTHLEVMKEDTRVDPRIVLPNIRLQPIQADFTPHPSVGKASLMATGSAVLALKTTSTPKPPEIKSQPSPIAATPLTEASLKDTTSQVSSSATKPVTSVLNSLSPKP